MMRNKVFLIGRLGKDPELKVTNSSKSVLSFSIAVKGLKSDESDWFRCEAWEKTAENIDKFFKKGDLIGVEGRLKVNKYTDSDGKEQKPIIISVEGFEFMGGKKEEGGESAPPREERKAAPKSAPAPASSYDDDSDIPF